MKFWIAYCNYGATGEGNTDFLAMAYTKQHAEEVFKERVHEYFHRGVYLVEVDGEKDTVPITYDSGHTYEFDWTHFVPTHIRNFLRNPKRRFPAGELMPGNWHFFTEFHFNYS